MLISGRMHRIRPDRAKASAFATGPANTQVFVRFEPLTCLNKQAFGLRQLLKQKLRFADLVVMAGWLHPFPFRTRP